MPKQLLGSDGLPKWFYTAEKAEAYIAKRSCTDTHHVVEEGGKFIIKEKEE